MARSANATASLVGLLTCAGLAVLSTASPPRSTGDASEYIAVSWQFSRARVPAFSEADRRELGEGLERLGSGFHRAQVEFPQLIGRDGREDTPHFWLYPLLATPLVMASEAFGAHPSRGFAALNIVGLALAGTIVAAHISWWVAALLVAGPVIWWADKPLYDALVVAAVAAALAWQRKRPAVAVITLACAGLQNPLLAVGWGLFAVWTWLGADVGAPRRQVLVATAAGAAANLIPPAYYWTRLGVVSPLQSFTQPGVPALGELAAFLIDPDIGVLWSAPIVVGLLTISAVAVWQSIRGHLTSLDLWCPLAILGVLLLGFAQSVNVNHGGTPGPNRWGLWLLPGFVILPARSGVFSRIGQPILAASVAASAAFSLINFRPSLPERYLAPSAVATWMTDTVPMLYQPPLEVFAERVSHREPPWLPVAATSCAKVVVADGWMAAPCPPPAIAPNACEAGGWCYADTFREQVSGHALPTPRFFWKGAPNTWPAFGPAAAAIRRQLLAYPGPWVLDEPGSTSERVRAVHDSRGVVAVRNGATTFVVLTAPGQQPRLVLRTPRRLRATAIVLGSDTVVDQQWIEPTGEAPSQLVLPGGRTLGVLLTPDP